MGGGGADCTFTIAAAVPFYKDPAGTGIRCPLPTPAPPALRPLSPGSPNCRFAGRMPCCWQWVVKPCRFRWAGRGGRTRWINATLTVTVKHRPGALLCAQYARALAAAPSAAVSDSPQSSVVPTSSTRLPPLSARAIACTHLIAPRYDWIGPCVVRRLFRWGLGVAPTTHPVSCPPCRNLPHTHAQMRS